MFKIVMFIFILAGLLAKLELQIEGKRAGWAAMLPCWKKQNKFINTMLGNKPLTGYHMWLMITYLFMFHSPYLFIPFTLKTELILMGFFFWFWILEDFFWFLENDAFKLKNFKKGQIGWHKRWIFGLPISYIWGMSMGTGLLVLGKYSK